jgi:hypothetical protein
LLLGQISEIRILLKGLELEKGTLAVKFLHPPKDASFLGYVRLNRAIVLHVALEGSPNFHILFAAPSSILFDFFLGELGLGNLL